MPSVKPGKKSAYPSFREGVDSHVRRTLGDIPTLENALLTCLVVRGGRVVRNIHSLKEAGRILHYMAKNVEAALAHAEKDRNKEEAFVARVVRTGDK